MKTRLALSLDQHAAERYTPAAAAVAAVVLSSEGITPFGAVAESEPAAIAHWPRFTTVSQGEGGLGARLDYVYRQ